MKDIMRGWSTADEIEWLRNIGKSHASLKNVSQVSQLEKYIKNFHKRVDWGKMNKAEVLLSAMQLLKEKTERQPKIAKRKGLK